MLTAIAGFIATMWAFIVKMVLIPVAMIGLFITKIAAVVLILGLFLTTPVGIWILCGMVFVTTCSLIFVAAWSAKKVINKAKDLKESAKIYKEMKAFQEAYHG
jgi:hypothetical protein